MSDEKLNFSVVVSSRQGLRRDVYRRIQLSSLTNDVLSRLKIETTTKQTMKLLHHKFSN